MPCSLASPAPVWYNRREVNNLAKTLYCKKCNMDVPEGEYLVFEHGPFNFETENVAVEQKIEQAMKDFDYAASGYELDTAPGRVFYFYHDCKRFWKYVRPVHKINKA